MTSGTLNVGIAGGATISAGANGSGTLTLTGTQAQINAALATLSYQGNLDFNGSDTLTVLSTDSAGTPLTDTDTVAITVTPVNDAPVNTVPGAQTVERGHGAGLHRPGALSVERRRRQPRDHAAHGGERHARRSSLAGGATITPAPTAAPR